MLSHAEQPVASEEARRQAMAAAFGALVPDRQALSRPRQHLILSLVSTVSELAQGDLGTGDLKIIDAALSEMTNAFRIFRPYRNIRKITMFGSARTKPEQAVYQLARDLAAHLADGGWMVVTGAGPGIMAAGLEGAGRERSFGVNIRLPTEDGANPFIAQDPKLVEMRYFFTRKLMLIKESDGYAVLPGGFGTQDECYELLTLLQTGKAEPAPVVLVETPGGNYWEDWKQFVVSAAMEHGYISPEDLALFRVANSVDEAAEEILGFYRNYHSCRWVGDLLVIRLHHAPSQSELEELNRRFGDIVAQGRIRPTGALAPERATMTSLSCHAWPFASTSGITDDCACSLTPSTSAPDDTSPRLLTTYQHPLTNGRTAMPTDRPMQLGMIGLGRMGANLVRRLMRDGHRCVVYDVQQAAVEELVGEGATGASSLEEFVQQLEQPRAAWIMVPAGVVDATLDQLVPLLQTGDTVIDGGNSYYRDDITRAERLSDRGLHYVDVGTSGGVFGLERGFCLMIGGENEVVDRLDPIFKTIAPGEDSAPPTPSRKGTGGTAQHGYFHCGPTAPATL